MQSHLFRHTIVLGMIAFISCDLGDLEGPIPPSYSRTTNPPYEIVLDSTNLIENGDFENGTTGWRFDVDNPGVASFGVSTLGYQSPHSLHADIQQLGNNFWSINLVWDELEMENEERYQVSFNLKSRSGQSSVRVAISMNYEPWTDYVSRTYYPAQVWEEHSFDFTSPAHAADGSLFVFNFNDLGEFWIDNVKVQQYVQVDL